MTLFIDPVIGELRISEVGRKDMAKLNFDMSDKPYQANRMLGVFSINSFPCIADGLDRDILFRTAILSAIWARRGIADR